MAQDNPYEELSAEKKLEIENAKKAIAERQSSVIRLAAECLADPKFMRYADEFKSLRREIMDKLRQPIDSDPIKDAHYIRACINTILVLDMLIEGPARDAKKG